MGHPNTCNSGCARIWGEFWKDGHGGGTNRVNILSSSDLFCPLSSAALCRPVRRLFLSPSAHGSRKASPSVILPMFPFVTHDLLHQPFRASARKWHPCPSRDLLNRESDVSQVWRSSTTTALEKCQQLKCSQLNKAEHGQWVSEKVLSGDRELGHHTEERSHSLGDPQHHPQGSLSTRVDKGQHTHFSPRATVLSAILAVSLLYAIYTIYIIYIYYICIYHT